MCYKDSVVSPSYLNLLALIHKKESKQLGKELETRFTTTNLWQNI